MRIEIVKLSESEFRVSALVGWSRNGAVWLQAPAFELGSGSEPEPLPSGRRFDGERIWRDTIVTAREGSTIWVVYATVGPGAPWLSGGTYPQVANLSLVPGVWAIDSTLRGLSRLVTGRLQ